MLRLTNVYGPGMADKDSLVPRLMRAAADGTVIEIYGDGLQRRDLVHVHDVARALVLALADWPSGPVIIGSGTLHHGPRAGRGRPRRHRPPDPRPSHVPPKTGEMPAVVVGHARARGLGWEPAVSLIEGMRTAWAGLRAL